MRAAGILLYRLEGGKPLFLLLLARHGGHFTPPKGHVDPTDADDEATAIRETREETGLAVAREALDPGFRAAVRYDVRSPRGTYPKEVVYFLAPAPPGPVRLSEEHVDFRWVAPEETGALIPWKDLRGVLLGATARLTERGITT